MNVHLIPVRPDARPHVRAIEALVARHGATRVVLAVVNVLFRRRKPVRRYEHDLSDHLRRDIGIDAAGRGRTYWEL